MFQKFLLFMRYYEKCGKDREATNGDIIWRMRVVCCISKATRAHAHAHIEVPGHPHTYIYTHEHARTYTRACTHIHKYVLIAFPWKICFR